MAGSIYISHRTALEYWRTNPPWYVLEGADRDLRSVQNCARTLSDFRAANLPESEFGAPPFDILVPASNAPRCPDNFRPHRQKMPLPPHALYPLWQGVYVVSPEVCFLQMCKTLTFVEALELGMELCGIYALRPNGPEKLAKRNYPLIRAEALRRRLESWQDAKGIKPARRVARYLATGSASPMETKVYLLLCLPLQYGGYNLGRPELNPEMPLTPAEQEILRVTRIFSDFLWRKQKLVVEYDGQQHEEKQQARHDALRQTILEARGYTVRRVTRYQVYNPLAFDSFASSIRKLLCIRTRPITPKQQYAREELRAQLLSEGHQQSVR